MTLTGPDVAALFGVLLVLLTLQTVLLTVVLGHRLDRLGKRLDGLHHRLMRTSARLDEVHDQIHEKFGPLDNSGIETKTRTLPRQRSAEELS